MFHEQGYMQAFFDLGLEKVARAGKLLQRLRSAPRPTPSRDTVQAAHKYNTRVRKYKAERPKTWRDWGPVKAVGQAAKWVDNNPVKASLGVGAIGVGAGALSASANRGQPQGQFQGYQQQY